MSLINFTSSCSKQDNQQPYPHNEGDNDKPNLGPISQSISDLSPSTSPSVELRGKVTLRGKKQKDHESLTDSQQKANPNQKRIEINAPFKVSDSLLEELCRAEYNGSNIASLNSLDGSNHGFELLGDSHIESQSSSFNKDQNNSKRLSDSEQHEISSADWLITTSFQNNEKDLYKAEYNKSTHASLLNDFEFMGDSLVNPQLIFFRTYNDYTITINGKKLDVPSKAFINYLNNVPLDELDVSEIFQTITILEKKFTKQANQTDDIQLKNQSQSLLQFLVERKKSILANLKCTKSIFDALQAIVGETYIDPSYKVALAEFIMCKSDFISQNLSKQRDIKSFDLLTNKANEKFEDLIIPYFWLMVEASKVAGKSENNPHADAAQSYFDQHLVFPVRLNHKQEQTLDEWSISALHLSDETEVTTLTSHELYDQTMVETLKNFHLWFMAITGVRSDVKMITDNFEILLSKYSSKNQHDPVELIVESTFSHEGSLKVKNHWTRKGDSFQLKCSVQKIALKNGKEEFETSEFALDMKICRLHQSYIFGQPIIPFLEYAIPFLEYAIHYFNLSKEARAEFRQQNKDGDKKLWLYHSNEFLRFSKYHLRKALCVKLGTYVFKETHKNKAEEFFNQSKSC